jgi:hypothetical protein
MTVVRKVLVNCYFDSIDPLKPFPVGVFRVNGLFMTLGKHLTVNYLKTVFLLWFMTWAA